MRSLVVVLLACSLCEAVFQGQLTSRTSSVVHIDSCTASVLNSRYILTAAHCLYPLKAAGRLSMNPIEVHVSTDGGFRTGVTAWYIPKEFNWIDRYGSGAANDAAVVRLRDPLPASAVPVRWETTAPNGAGTSISFLGYGGTGPAGPAPTPGLREGQARLETCLDKYRADGTLCVQKTGQSALCPGDSGGPAFSAGVQVGIASFGSCHLGISIWANVQRLRPWIRAVLNGELPPTPPKLFTRLPNESFEDAQWRDSREASAWWAYLARERAALGIGQDGVRGNPIATVAEILAGEAASQPRARPLSALERLRQEQEASSRRR